MRWPRAGNAGTIHVMLILLLGAWILHGCASVPLAPPGLDQDAKRFHPPRGAGPSLYRPRVSVGHLSNPS